MSKDTRTKFPDYETYEQLRGPKIRERFMDLAFGKALREAYKDDVDLLCSLIRDHSLDKNKRSALAVFIEYKLKKRKRKGRPKDSVPTPKQRAEQVVVDQVQELEAKWRAKHGRKRLPNGLRKQTIDEVIADLGDIDEFGGWRRDFECDFASADPDRIFSLLNRGQGPKAKSRKNAN